MVEAQWVAHCPLATVQGSILPTLTSLHARAFTVGQRRRLALDKLMKYQEVQLHNLPPPLFTACTSYPCTTTGTPRCSLPQTLRYCCMPCMLPGLVSSHHMRRHRSVGMHVEQQRLPQDDEA